MIQKIRIVALDKKNLFTLDKFCNEATAEGWKLLTVIEVGDNLFHYFTRDIPTGWDEVDT